MREAGLLARVKAAFEEHGTYTAAAAALNIPRSTVWTALNPKGKSQGKRRYGKPDAAAVLEAYGRLGSYSAAARELGLAVNTVRNYVLGLHADGKPPAASVLLPARATEYEDNPAGVYLLTTAQGGVEVHEGFLRNLEAYARFRGATIHVAKTIYDVREKRNVKDEAEAGDPQRWDPLVEPLLVEKQQRYGNAAFEFTATLNIIPTAVRPLSGVSFPPGVSSAVPHQKAEMVSLPSTSGRPVFRYTTGSCTRPCHIQRKAGQAAQFHHSLGALILEVAEDGAWWARHIGANEDGAFYDLGFHVYDGMVIQNVGAAAVTLGDVHFSEKADEVYEATCVAEGSVLSELRPQVCVLHDLFSGISANPHSDWAERYARRFDRAASVSGELRELHAGMDELVKLHRQTDFAVVASNHDAFLGRWLASACWRELRTDALLFLTLAKAKCEALDAGEPINLLEAGLNYGRSPLQRFRFLHMDESFRVGGVEHGMHGHLGANGARGSAQGLRAVAEKITVGHSHTAQRTEGVVQVGTTSRLRLSYNHGPSSWSHTHAVQYADGHRALLTFHETGGRMDWRLRTPEEDE